MPIVAWYMLSNESYMNLVIRDVLPTLCSPKNTNLHRQGQRTATLTKARDVQGLGIT
jgi:hypothetical protein